MASRAYRKALAEAQRHHERSKTYSGKFLRPHKPFLVRLIEELGIKSALDYGCGKGEQYRWTDPADGKTMEEAFGFEVAKYDPAWPPYAAEPEGFFGLVICTHVLGSIPEKDLPWVLDRIFGFATRAVYIAEKLGPVRKTALSDLVERDQGEWLDLLRDHAAAAIERDVRTVASFRHRNDAGEVQVERFRYGMGLGWQMVQA